MQTNTLFALWDRKAQLYLGVSAQNSVANAVREFTQVVMTSGTMISQYPADFDLLAIGSIDLESGVLTDTTPPTLLINGLVALEDAQRAQARTQQVLYPQPSSEASLEAS